MIITFKPGSYRRPLEQEPIGGSQRRFTIQISGGRISRPMFGAGAVAFGFDLDVNVAYARLGGDAGTGSDRGDRLGVNSTAGMDLVLLADALTDQRNWSPEVTKVREVRFVTKYQIIDEPLREVWQVRFFCEVTLDWPV